MVEEWRGGPVLVGRRVVVIGTSSSGKTTMARRLSRVLRVPHIELDALHWEPNWTEASDEVFRGRVIRALRHKEWVVDGNYNQVRDLIWPRADTIVWLDFALHVMLWRLTLRTFRRVFRRVELWGGNRESLRTAFFSKESLYVWVVTTYKKRRKQYPEFFAEPEHTHLRIVRLTSPKAADVWLRGVTKTRVRFAHR